MLAGILRTEILPRLRGLHPDDDTTPAHARNLARLLLAEPDRFRDDIAARIASGTAWSAVSARILGPAARGLGLLWEGDEADFLDVTEAMGRLQAASRELGRLREGGGVWGGRSILLAPAPGETHAFGLSHVAGVFRDAGWQVSLLTGPSRDPGATLAAALGAQGFDVLGLSLACDDHAPRLRGEMEAIRRASRNPTLRVVVGGALVARGGITAASLGADGCITDDGSHFAAAPGFGRGETFSESPGFGRIDAGTGAAPWPATSL